MPIKVRSGGSWVQVTDSTSSSVSDVTVVYTGRDTNNCTIPITVTGSSSKTINIPASSNAFGAKYVQDSEPTTSICEGDIWYDTSGSESVANESSQTIEATICFQNPTSLNQNTTFPISGGTRNGGVFGPYTISSGVTLTISNGSTFTII